MTPRSITVALALSLATAAIQGHAQTVGPSGDSRRMGKADEASARAAESTEVFESMDRNEDGAISTNEATGIVATSFNNLDKSLDGKIDYAEFVQMDKPVKDPNEVPEAP
ncbi:MAG: EF-hand domain-containing protein [Panacagrimonas sp.]